MTVLAKYFVEITYFSSLDIFLNFQSSNHSVCQTFTVNCKPDSSLFVCLKMKRLQLKISIKLTAIHFYFKDFTQLLLDFSLTQRFSNEKKHELNENCNRICVKKGIFSFYLSLSLN